ncbi:MAG: class I SAM-dependent methyltransferase [Nanoarchaeota archaeon]
MYSDERINWWISRSNSIEYQRAYDHISKRIQTTNNGVLIDAGSGPGEIIKRVARNKGYKLVIGIDSSIKMLEYARENLARSKIKASIRKNGFNINPNDQGVILFLEDIIDCKLPKGIADTTIVSFPEATSSGKVTEEDKEMIERAKDIGLDLCPENYNLFFGELRVYRNLIGALKKAGQFSHIKYDIYDGKKSDYMFAQNMQAKMQATLFGAKLELVEFVDSLRIWNDTNEVITSSLPNPDLFKFGYRISQFRKKE